MKIPKNKQYILFGGTFVLANKLQAVADKRVMGLSTKQWFLMRNLHDMPMDPPPTITMLAKETNTSRQNITKMLEGLQRQNYVVLRYSPEDHRSQTVKMTEQGAMILRQAAKNAVPFFAELFSGIGAEECEVAAGVVLKMMENLSKMQEDNNED